MRSCLAPCRRRFPLHIAQDGTNAEVAALARSLEPYGIRCAGCSRSRYLEYSQVLHGLHAILSCILLSLMAKGEPIACAAT